MSVLRKRSDGATSDKAAAIPSEDGADRTLLRVTRRLLAHHGRDLSEGAVRDLSDVTSGAFDRKAALSALRQAGLQASYGPVPASGLTADHLPAIGFLKTGQPVLLTEGATDDALIIEARSGADGFVRRETRLSEGGSLLAPKVILARKIVEEARSVRPGDWFWSTMFRERSTYVQVILASALINLLGLSTSLFIMVVYDRVVPNEAVESLLALTAGVLIALGFDFLLKTLRSRFIDRASRRTDARMSRMIFDRILNLKGGAVSHRSGATASVVREFETLREFFTSATLVAIVDLPFIFLFVWVISLIAGPLAYVPLVAVPIVILSGLVIQPLLSRLTDGAMRTGTSKQGVLVETLNGLETIRVTGSGRLMRRRFEAAADGQSELGLKSRTLSQFAINVAASTQQLAQVGTIVFGVFLIREEAISMGAMIAAVILGGRALGPLGQIAAALTRANGARAAYRSLSSLMEDAQGPEAPRLSRPDLNGGLELRDVTYRFPGAAEPSVRNVSFRVRPGERVAIMGMMGSGKSTLLRLIAGLIEPEDGVVLLDGVDLRQVDPSDRLRATGVLLQEPWLFSGTLKENLRMGFAEYDDAHLLRVARLAGVDRFVASHPRGYEMEIGERGTGLSGGQRQSICLARALLHDPPLLLLDEPTSSMDVVSEADLILRLRQAVEGKTLMMVTHRNALLDLADRVLVMEAGELVADTTPDRIRAAQKGSKK